MKQPKLNLNLNASFLEAVANFIESVSAMENTIMKLKHEIDPTWNYRLSTDEPLSNELLERWYETSRGITYFHWKMHADGLIHEHGVRHAFMIVMLSRRLLREYEEGKPDLRNEAFLRDNFSALVPVQHIYDLVEVRNSEWHDRNDRHSPPHSDHDDATPNN